MSSPKFGLGDKVFAKMRGYPPWPAKVEGVADETPNKMKYHVYFYGTKQIAVCKQEELFAYVDNREKYGTPKKNKGFNEGILQIDSELGLVLNTQTRNDLNIVPVTEPEGNELTRLDDQSSKKFRSKPNTSPRKRASIPSLNVSKERPIPDGDAVGNGTLQVSGHSGKRSKPNSKDIPSKSKSKINSVPVVIQSSKDENGDKFKQNSPNEILLSSLKIEAQLHDIDLAIQSSLSLKRADPEACLKCLDDLLVLKINSLILKKHPHIVETLRKLKRYVGNTGNWNMSDEEIASFNLKATSIQAKAKIVFDRIQSMFVVPHGKTFLEYFEEQLNEFKSCTKDMTLEDICQLTRDPTENLTDNTREEMSC